jgi:predicted kinase
MIIIRGLPGSGKSTLAESLAFQNPDTEIVEADMFFMHNGEYLFDKNKLRDAHEWCQERARAILNDWRIPIVANTFTTGKELKPYFQMCKDYSVIPTVYTCHSDWGSIHNVPAETMLAMRQRFQWDLSGMMKEYFDVS